MVFAMVLLLSSTLAAEEALEFKTEEGRKIFEEAIALFESGKYKDARATFVKSLREAESSTKKIIRSYIDDARLGLELEKCVEKFQEKRTQMRAYVDAHKLLEKAKDSRILPKVEKFIAECEQALFFVIEDFEPDGKTDQAIKKAKKSGSTTSSTVRDEYEIQTNPQFVRHGKGSLKWLAETDHDDEYYYEGFRTQESPKVFALPRFRYLKFWVFLPKAEDGALRVFLMPRDRSYGDTSLFTKKSFQLRGKVGWHEVVFDLRRDFANTQNCSLEEVRFVRLVNMHPKARTIFVDFIHLSP